MEIELIFTFFNALVIIQRPISGNHKCLSLRLTHYPIKKKGGRHPRLFLMGHPVYYAAVTNSNENRNYQKAEIKEKWNIGDYVFQCIVNTLAVK